jgi:3-mercaptopropionate dioxygenase
MLDTLIFALREATKTSNAEAKVKAILMDFVRDHETASSLMPDFNDDDVILFEDETISIWFCRFKPGTKVPPHDHRMSATIGVFKGTEFNEIYAAGRLDGGRLAHENSISVSAGEVLQIPEDKIHSVACTSQHASEAIHVYLGPLSKIDRALYDVDAGAKLAFTDENYAALTKT